WKAKSCAIYTGDKIDGPLLIGNIGVSDDPTSPGFWGLGHENTFKDGRPYGRIKNPDFHATVAQLLGTEYSDQTAKSLISFDKSLNRWVSVLNKMKSS
ncbi:MAG: hypothetical protein MJK18_02670, partial [Bdellovibrionales bacterium]|nr:hypothetical protein [Bdellovibrionales bacterium]